MKISVGSDHAGYKLKQIVIEWLKDAGYQVIDKGTFGPESVDYPDFASDVAKDVSQGVADKGIVICASGSGVTIAANKIKGIRAVNCYNEEIAVLSRAHNDANVLALGERFLNADLALRITKSWLETDFEAGRHQRRIDNINKLEQEN